MTSPELTLQTAKGVSSVHIDLNNYMKIVTNPEIDSLIGYTAAVKGYPVVQANHKEITGNENAVLKRIRIKFKNGSQATIYASKTGTTVIISGKRKYEETAKIVGQMFHLRSMNYQITNTSMTWQLGKSIQLHKIVQAFPQKNVAYNPELFPALTLKLHDPVVSVKIFSNGVIIASGVGDMSGIKKRVQDAIGNFTGVNVGHQLPARKNLKGKREHMRNERYPIVSWENNTKGHYVKPGPNRQPRLYKLPANPKLVISKVRKAYANAGVPIRAATRRALGLSPPVINNVTKGMTLEEIMMKNWRKSPSPVIPQNSYSPPKKVSKDLLTWSANKNGYYVKPGPGGLPKLYKIPKGIKAAKKTVLKAYKEAGVKIPNKVRAIFEINKSPSPPKVNVGPRAVLKNQAKVLLGGKDCMRYTVKELIEIMRKRKIAYSGLTKAKMCARLYGQNYAPAPKSVAKQTPNFTVNRVPHYILRNTQQMQRGGKTKKLSAFTRPNLVTFASKLGLGHGSKATKSNLINIILGKKQNQSGSSSLGSLENQLMKAFEEETQKKKNNSINARAKLMFNNANAQQFAVYYRLHGGTPSKLQNLEKNFRALKLKEQMAKYGGEIM